MTNEMTKTIDLPDPIRYGNEGPAVRSAQILLNDHGANPRVNLDGVFGPLTSAAVLMFKGMNNLGSGSVVDGATWALLLRPPPRQRYVPVAVPGSQALVVGSRMALEVLMRDWYAAGMTEAQCGVLLLDYMLHTDPWTQMGDRGVMALALEIMR